MFDDNFFDFRRMQRQMNRMMANMTRGMPKSLGFEPMADIRNTGNFFIVELDMPGIEKNNVQIFADAHTVEVKAERKQQKITDKKNFYSQERSYAGYHRVLPMPAKIDPKHINAEYKNGVLTLKIAKKDKKAIKRIKVRVK